MVGIGFGWIGVGWLVLVSVGWMKFNYSLVLLIPPLKSYSCHLSSRPTKHMHMPLIDAAGVSRSLHYIPNSDKNVLVRYIFVPKNLETYFLKPDLDLLIMSHRNNSRHQLVFTFEAHDITHVGP